MKASEDMLVDFIRDPAQRTIVCIVVFVTMYQFANWKHLVAQFNVMYLSTLLLLDGLPVDLPVYCVEYFIGPFISKLHGLG